MKAIHLFLAAMLAAFSGLASATPTGVDFSTLTDAVDFTTVVTAILAVAAVKVLPMVAMWGARKVLGAIGR